MAASISFRSALVPRGLVLDSASCSHCCSHPSIIRTQSSRRRISVNSFGGSMETVADLMSNSQIVSCTPDNTVDEALEMLVKFRVTGLPVLNSNKEVVGVVSDFDLLALESLGRCHSATLFPEADTTWQAFKDVKAVLMKGTGKRVSDVMTKKPYVVTPETSLNDATKILLMKKIRRLPVVDASGKLVGLISRRDIVKAAFEARKGTKEPSYLVSLDDG